MWSTKSYSLCKVCAHTPAWMPSVPLGRIAVLPRTHVWCSGRMSALLFGIPSLGPPQFPRSPTLYHNFSSAYFFATPSLPVFPFFHPLQCTVISHVFTRLSDTSDCAGVRSDQTCRRRLYAHSDTQRCTERQRVPLDLIKEDMLSSDLGGN